MKHSAELKIVQPNEEPAVETAIDIHDFQVWFADTHVLQSIDVGFEKNRINCIVGPSGSGKSTLIRSINRINDGAKGYRCEGTITFGDRNVLDQRINLSELRRQIGMVFQKPCVFPRSIAENVLFGIQKLKKLSRQEKIQVVEDNLKAVSLWSEVSHRLQDKAISLSIGQQQRLCIARTLAVQPEVLLLDEPTSSLDPVAARAIENLILELKQQYTIVFVTHNIQQAERIADRLIFMCNGMLIEAGPKHDLFQAPKCEQTREYLAEGFCDC